MTDIADVASVGGVILPATRIQRCGMKAYKMQKSIYTVKLHC